MYPDQQAWRLAKPLNLFAAMALQHFIRCRKGRAEQSLLPSDAVLFMCGPHQDIGNAMGIVVALAVRNMENLNNVIGLDVIVNKLLVSPVM